MSLFMIKQSKFLSLELDVEISTQFYEAQHENSTKNTINTSPTFYICLAL